MMLFTSLRVSIFSHSPILVGEQYSNLVGKVPMANPFAIKNLCIFWILCFEMMSHLPLQLQDTKEEFPCSLVEHLITEYQKAQENEIT